MKQWWISKRILERIVGGGNINVIETQLVKLYNNVYFELNKAKLVTRIKRVSGLLSSPHALLNFSFSVGGAVLVYLIRMKS